MASVSSLLGMDRTTLTAAIKPLERRGLLTVATDPSDRRGRRLSLTGEGKTLLASALPVWERTHEKVNESLEGGSADYLRKGLNAIS
jgi:DNA-binding MarR family transcriptional regulator